MQAASVGSGPAAGGVAAVASGTTIVVHAHGDRARAFVRTAFPRRKGRIVLTRTFSDFDAALKDNLIDAALVDIGGGHDDAWRVAAIAREYPTVPFFGIAALRAVEGPALAQCAAYEFADLLIDGIDDGVARDIVMQQSYSARFARALDTPPPALALETPLQRSAWQGIVAHAGRPVRTSELARSLDVTREHLSRSFGAGDAPNLKRVIDLVRVIAAAELAKNPGYAFRDVARILGFASSSHLSSTAQRIIGSRSASLARLRTADLLERFVGRG